MTDLEYLDEEEKAIKDFKDGLEQGTTCPFCNGEGCDNCENKGWI